MPASRMVSVEHVKYLKARSRPSLSKDMCGSIGSLTAVHIRSVMFLVPAVRRSLSDSRHIYLIIIEILSYNNNNSNNNNDDDYNNLPNSLMEEKKNVAYTGIDLLAK